MNKKFLSYLLIILLVLPIIYFSSTKDVEAAVATPSSRVMKSETTNPGLKMNYGNYRYYPARADDSNSTWMREARTGTHSLLQDGTRVEALPWAAAYGTIITSGDRTGANSLGTDQDDCSVRYKCGGPGVWLPPSAQSGWALRGEVDKTVAPWNKTIYDLSPGTGHAATSSQFVAAENPKVVGWRTDLESADAEPIIWGNNVETTYPRLLSAGIGYFRNEFSFSDEEWAFIQAYPNNFKLRLASRADDFHVAYLNGVDLNNYSVRGVGLGGTGTDKAIYAPYNTAKLYDKPTTADIDSYGTGSISTSTLLSTYNLQKTGNVIAFQVADKAVWTAGATSNSNAIGLWFEAELNFTQPASTLTATLTASPSSGDAPLDDVDLTANVTGGTATGNITYSFDCTGDGTYEHTSAATANTTYTWPNGCDYATAGSYKPKAKVVRESIESYPEDTVTVNTPVPRIKDCIPSPTTGISPLAVRVQATYENVVGTPRIDYLMGDGTAWILDKPITFYYTYSQAGKYKIQARLNSDPSNVVDCNAEVNVSDDSTTDGGEVAP